MIALAEKLAAERQGDVYGRTINGGTNTLYVSELTFRDIEVELLDALIARQPGQAAAWLDFEISFGTFETGLWTIEHSTLREFEGRRIALALHRVDAANARVVCEGDASDWSLVEWRARHAVAG